jgi:alpha-beta hydrolase superfamily lysophospholipase
MKSRILVVLIGMLALAAPAMADPHELRVPLHDGKLRWADLSATVCQQIHLPRWQIGTGEVSVEGWSGSLFLAALNASCGDGCRVSVSDGALIFHFDAHQMPGDLDQAKAALRKFVAAETPEATAAQARQYGLQLPAGVDPRRNLVVLIHGLDTDAGILRPLGDSLGDRGFQVAYFCYPADQGIDDSVKLFEQQLATVRQTYPGIRLDLIGHSMGGLIARDYVEGNDYRGDVDHLILVGTPNDGSDWAKFHLALKAKKEYEAWQTNPDWRWSWIITEGLGEGARDISPNSAFLAQLNAQPRRPGVKYTIIAGSHSAVATFGAECTESLADRIPTAAQSWWGLDRIHHDLERTAGTLRQQNGSGDGPVSLGSARLSGVDDVVIVPADHVSLILPSADAPPAALDVIVDRLGDKSRMTKPESPGEKSE